MKRSIMIAGLIVLASPAIAEPDPDPDLEKGFAAALRGCEEWVLNPASWIDGPEPFLEVMDLGDKIGLVEEVNGAALPPPSLRAGNFYWRINSTADSGYILVTSDQLPMCHITGGGAQDLQPAVESVLSSKAFQQRWTTADGTQSMPGMATNQYNFSEDTAFSITISRADAPGGRTDRVQVLATAIYELPRQ